MSIIIPTLPGSLIPSEEDWHSVGWDLDTYHAYDNFAGKTFAEAVNVIADDAIARSEDLMWMPTRCIPFYFQAYAAYLMSPQAQWDSDGASCFIFLCEFKGEGDGIHAAEYLQILKTMAPLLRPVLEHMAAHQEFYDASVEIYGDFKTRVQKILSLDCFKE